MNSGKPKPLKNSVRAASGGIVAVIILIIFMFQRGVGTGDGTGDAGTGSAMVSTGSGTEAGSDTNTDGDAKPDLVLGDMTPEEKKALSEDVLGILIEEYSYFLVVPGEETVYRPVELKRLIELAQESKGDANGIRVQIVRRETSRTKAEVDLKTALTEAGIGEDAVYMPKDLLSE